ncbi:hypothetical protein EJB05_01794, partial [Eragrostis curvula]
MTSVHPSGVPGQRVENLVTTDQGGERIDANILGRDKSPSPYRLWNGNDGDNADHFVSVHFAVDGSGKSMGRLQKLGVCNVLVNLLRPIGSQCYVTMGNIFYITHDAALKQKSAMLLAVAKTGGVMEANQDRLWAMTSSAKA